MNIERLEKERLNNLNRLKEEENGKPDPKTIRFNLKEFMKNQTDLGEVLHFSNKNNTNSNDDVKNKDVEKMNSTFWNNSMAGRLSPRIKNDSELPNLKSRLKNKNIIGNYIDQSNGLKKNSSKRYLSKDKNELNSSSRISRRMRPLNLSTHKESV